MPVRVDHIGLPCRDPEVSARFLAGLLALPVEPDGRHGEHRRVLLDGGVFVVFQATPKIAPSHIAFAVEPDVFTALVAGLRAGGIAFGNDPDATSNGESHDRLGGRGRVYFRDPDNHLYEACC